MSKFVRELLSALSSESDMTGVDAFADGDNGDTGESGAGDEMRVSRCGDVEEDTCSPL